MWIIYNEKASTPVPDDLRKEVEDVVAKIASGEINTLAK